VVKTNRISGEEEKIYMPLGEFELRTTEFSHPEFGDDHVFAGYFFVANGRATAYPENIRLLAFDPSSKFAYYCKIQFTIRGTQSFTLEDFQSTVSDLSTVLLPDIMSCLPDWVEVSKLQSK
jgi:hypothetical protein